jgi:hypothetical protein
MAFAIGIRKKSVMRTREAAMGNRFLTIQRAKWMLFVSLA